MILICVHYFYRYSPEFLSSIKTLIAPPKCKLKGIAKQITAAHRSLEGLSTMDAMCWFVKVWSSLDLFGVEFLSCTNLDTKDKGLIGVSKNRVSCIQIYMFIIINILFVEEIIQFTAAQYLRICCNHYFIYSSM